MIHKEPSCGSVRTFAKGKRSAHLPQQGAGCRVRHRAHKFRPRPHDAAPQDKCNKVEPQACPCPGAPATPARRALASRPWLGLAAHAHIPTRPTLLVDGTPFGGDSNGAAQRGSTAAWRDAVSQLQQRAAVSRQPQQAGEERTLHKGQPAQQKSADSLLSLGFSALSFAFCESVRVTNPESQRTAQQP